MSNNVAEQSAAIKSIFSYQFLIMKTKLLLFIFSAMVFASCSTAYKSGQTPDDLYYSKPKAIETSVRTKTKDEVYENRQIRMAAYDARWRTLDDRYEYDYRYSPYSYGYNNGYYYNPYYYPYPVYSTGIKFVNPLNTTIRSANLNTYNNTINTYTPSKGSGNLKTTTVRGYNNRNNDAPPNNTYETRSYENRTYNPPVNNTNSSNTNSNTNTSSGSSIARPIKRN